MEKLDIKILSHDIQGHPTHELALSVLEGLSENPKKLPSRLFYDDKGSSLFKKIMQLEEYYPTKCEAEILKANGGKIAKHMKGKKFNLIELGCGDGAKTITILNSLREETKSFDYVPLDISQAAIEYLYQNLQKEYDQKIPFKIYGLVAEYFQGLKWLSENASDQNMVLFLGSNIGNFSRPMALRFLRHLWHSLNPNDVVLIGFDLKKDLDILYDAYNDKKGVTKEFNFNVLDRINKTLNGNFDRKNYQHQGLYNVQTGAMESYLISQCEHEVYIKDLDKSFSFKPWEPLHMEYSYKYLESDIVDYATSTGFEVIENYKDNKGYFVDSLWRGIK